MADLAVRRDVYHSIVRIPQLAFEARPQERSVEQNGAALQPTDSVELGCYLGQGREAVAALREARGEYLPRLRRQRPRVDQPQPWHRHHRIALYQEALAIVQGGQGD